MGFGDFWGAVADSVGAISDWLVQVVGAIWEALLQVLSVIWNVIVYVWDALVFVAKLLWRGLTALRLGKFGTIWSAIKRGFDRIRGALAWLKRYFFDPIERMRRQILEIYRRFFAPIVRFFDSLRVFVRILAIFNRRLAAKLDAKLWALEAKLLSPITASLRRLNSLASYFSAIVTVSGYLDRVTLLESLRRDALLVWEVMTNPRAALYTKPAPWQPPAAAQSRAELHQFLTSESGPMAPRVAAMREQFMGTLLELE